MSANNIWINWITHKKISVFVKKILTAYKKRGYKGGIKIFGTGTPWTEWTLKMLYCSKFDKIIPHSLATSMSL